jgi:hypothetical protein
VLSFIQSCAVLGPRLSPVPCEERFETLFPSAGRGEGLEIIGRIKIELPQYRIRGVCRMLYSPNGYLRLDFQHSSLFGALKEDVTVVFSDSIVMYDRERGQTIASDSSRVILQRSFGERIEPDDILYALLLTVPQCPELADEVLREAGTRWELNARWRDRDVVIRGDSTSGPLEFRQCLAGPRRCYVIRYGSYAHGEGFRYPRRIRLEREHAMERIELEVTSIKKLAVNASAF